MAAAVAAQTYLHVPGGEWTLNNLDLLDRGAMVGEGVQRTRIRRSTDQPIVKVRGAAYSGSGAFFPNRYAARVQDLTFYNDVAGSTQPLVDIAGASHMSWLRVQMESYMDGPSLLRLSQVWDSTFNQCAFASGGNSSGTNPAVEMVAGFTEGGTTWRQTKEIAFGDCWWEDYYGTALAATRPADYSTTKVEQVKLHGRMKFESLRSTVAHLLFAANHLDFEDPVYVRHWLTTGPVVDLANVRGAKGVLRFFGGSGGTYVKPSARINVPAASQFLELLLMVAEPQASDENVVTAAAPNDETNRLRILAPFPLLNGVSIKNIVQVGQYWIYVSSTGVVRRSLGFPALGTEGAALYDRPLITSAALSSATNAINTTDKYQGKQVYCTSVAKFLHTNGSSATSPWLNADGTTAFTPA